MFLWHIREGWLGQLMGVVCNINRAQAHSRKKTYVETGTIT